jgi:hypothetical protein
MEIAMIQQRLGHLTAERWDALLSAQDEQLALLRAIRDSAAPEASR